MIFKVFTEAATNIFGYHMSKNLLLYPICRTGTGFPIDFNCMLSYRAYIALDMLSYRAYSALDYELNFKSVA